MYTFYIMQAIFHNERWRLITFLGGPFDSTTDYRDLFADTCDSIGEFTDIHQHNEGAYSIAEDLRRFNFPLRNIDGRWVATVAPFGLDTFFVKVHPTAVWCTVYFGLNSYRCNISACNWSLSLSPRYWPGADGKLNLTEAGRWRFRRAIG